ncbi:hypothetical protein YB2330_002328 [Saitoella coloradoensis]
MSEFSNDADSDLDVDAEPTSENEYKSQYESQARLKGAPVFKSDRQPWLTFFEDVGSAGKSEVPKRQIKREHHIESSSDGDVASSRKPRKRGKMVGLSTEGTGALTEDDIIVLAEMKEGGSSWKEVAEHFGLKPDAIRKFYGKHQARHETWDEMKLQMLREASVKYDKHKWQVIGAEIGSKPMACETKAKELGLL